MKSRLWILGVVAWFSVCGTPGFAASYYINDNSTTGDVYTTATGNDANPGTTNAPKLTLGNVIGTCGLVPGDTVYIDTGSYGSSTVSNTVVGAVGNPIRFQGSTNGPNGIGTVFTSAGVNMAINGSHLAFTDIRAQGGTEGWRLTLATNCTFTRIAAISNSLYAFQLVASRSNSFQWCVAAGGSSAVWTSGGPRSNYFENCILLSSSATTLGVDALTIYNMVGCIIGGTRAFLSSTLVPDAGSRNIFWGTTSFSPDMETLSDFVRQKPTWSGNTVADPMFLNSPGLDFHVLSASGVISNGVWVTNAAVGYSPAIDFGMTNNLAYTNEPDPNGSRMNVGRYAGTAEASKSRTNAWLFAMTHNDGGALIRTGRLEWVGGNLGAGTTVDLQMSTNAGASWSDIATGLAATNESYTWVPSVGQQHPAVLWRVFVTTNPAVVATNARSFVVRAETNTAFSFYVNDGSTSDDVYCSAAGNNTNNGLSAAAPKRSLQAILDAYALVGGDTVYVDTGDYTTNFTTTLSRYDSGSVGNPLRIIGSSKGAYFNRASTSADTLELGGIINLEVENLRLVGGRYGLYGNGSSNITLRGVQVVSNRYGAWLAGSRHVFTGCLAADNTVNALITSGVLALSNQWVNGVMWGSPTSIVATTNSLSVSNSILGGGTALFGSQVVRGDYNVVWQTQVGLTYSSFSALQNAGFGWSQSLYADPFFANSAGGDYHLKSVMGRYNPATLLFETNDVVHSPAIDLGDPVSTAHTNEPAPNGTRVNVGMHGGTAQASKSRTNAWLQVLSYTDGGTLDAAAGSWLRWTGGNLGPGATVTLWLSRDAGASWSNIVVGLNATNGAYFYINSSTNDPSSLFGRWMVSLDGSSPLVTNATTTNFNYKNGKYVFYVNDGYTAGDVYCSAVGNDANLGVSAGSPMQSLAALVDRYQLGPGDQVYVDTGSYYFPDSPVVLTSADSGASTNWVTIVGSTNRLAGGTIFGRTAAPINLGFDFRSGASNILLRDIVVSNAVRGVAVSNSANIRLENVEVRTGSGRAFEMTANAQQIELLRCVAHGGGIGVYLQQVTNISVRNSVFWQNTANAVYVGSQVGLLLENSILASSNNNAALYSIAATNNGWSSDYNGVHAGPNTRVGVNRSSGALADNLAAWQILSGGQDIHGIPGNPQMADPDRFDYHLKTEQTLGRVTTNGTRTADSVSSPLLDAGNPASGFSLEPAPSGGRINIGRFGGTTEASSAMNTPWLEAVSYNDAGGVQDGATALRWIAGGGFTTETVKVELSVDGGKSWGLTVTSGIPATNGMTAWTVTGLPDTPAATWRVVCIENTNLVSQSTNYFAIRNQPLNIFIGTADTNEAVYTTGPGMPDNWMATTSAPLNSVRTAFDRFDLEPGDRIWVDRGLYLETAPILVGMKNSGTSNNPVQVTGNTNSPYNGVVLARSSRTAGAYVVQLAYAGGVKFSSLMVSNAFIGVHMENTAWTSMDRVRVGYCLTNGVYAGIGTWSEITNSIIEQSLYAGLHLQTGAVVKFRGGLIRNNAKTMVILRGGDMEIKNSVLEASGRQQFIYYWVGGSRLVSDFNNIRATDGANVAGGLTRASDRFLIDWQISSGFSNDMSSFGYAADFADEAALDFHLRSEYGRFDPLTRAFVTNDTVTSRLIDLGDPAFPYANEPTNSCGRIDVGLYGNSPEASKGAEVGSLVPLTMSDGGTVRDTVKLYWAWNCLPANEILNVTFSADGGLTWTNIATNIYADVGTSGLSWNTTNFPSTPQGVWRVCTTNGAICAQTPIFAVKNASLTYYVNDASTIGDVYCTAPGSSTNNGVDPGSPIDSLEKLLNLYDIEPGDTIFVDTGIYPRGSPLVLAIPAVDSTNRLVIQGSTNEAAGGSVFTNASGAVIELQNMQNVDLRDLRLHGGDQGLLLSQSSSNLFWRVRSIGARKNAFELTTASDQNRFLQCAALNFSQTGFHVVKTLTILTPATTNYWSGGVIASLPATTSGVAVSTGALMGVMAGRVYVSNSVWVAGGPAHDVFVISTNAIRGDFNCYHRPYDRSRMGVVSAGEPAFGVAIQSYGDLESFAAWNQSDTNSFAADPLFASVTNLDLHPRSAGGRYDPDADLFVEDAENSPLIDTADPAMDWSAETAPNGSRANLGVYGNDPQASRTTTNGTFVLLTLNQGGVVSGSQTLKWVARGGATNAGHLVNIQVSTNSGATWTINVAIGVPASAGSFTWNAASAPSVPTARWRVQSQSQATWVTVSERDFLIHNTNMTYYVNDAATANDVYCTAPGAVGNSGVLPGAPMASLAAVLEQYNLEAGDRVLIDTGNYAQSSPTVVGPLDGGTVADPLQITGSTNYPGTAFTGAGIRFENVRGVSLRNIRFAESTAAADVVAVYQAEDITCANFDILGGSQSGVDIIASSNVLLRNFAVMGARTNGVSSKGSFNTRLEYGVIWSNQSVQVACWNQLTGVSIADREASSVAVSNCALGAFGLRIPIYEVRGTILANHNNLYTAGGGLVALSYTNSFAQEFDSVAGWSRKSLQDAASLSHVPNFANDALGDFHPKSSAGRWDPASGTWQLDPAAENSPLIDAGNPAVACTEPAPNGGRVNIGRYGNTAEASKTPTNGALTLISFYKGGRASGTNVLITWNASGSATNAVLTIMYSSDGGATWSNLAVGVSATNQADGAQGTAGSWTWNSMMSADSVQARLKLEATDGSTAQSIANFTVGNQSFRFYLNDDSTAGDIYCSAIGNNANSGLTTNLPMADLNALLERYDLEGGDIVYIDTGRYRGTPPWRITQLDSAGDLASPPVVFQGATNSIVNGTVLDRSFNTIGIQVDYAVGVRLRNITVSNTVTTAVLLNNCFNIETEWVTVGAGNNGIVLDGGSQLSVKHGVFFNANLGVVVQNWDSATNTVYPVVDHNVFWELEDAAIKVNGRHKVSARNNIIVVPSGEYAYDISDLGELTADYNSIWLRTGARVYRQTQRREVSPVPVIYESMGSWAEASGQDLHSYDGNPQLADAAKWDFHLQSRAGRWDPGLGVWTNDALTSPLIDAGLPSSTAWTNEPAPHGSRVNIGLYGGTAQASITPTNSALNLLTLNRGGVASGQVALNWSASGRATGHTVRIEVSIDNGATWNLVVSNAAATLGGITWSSLSVPSSPLALWRVQDEVETNVVAAAELNFVLHNDPISYFVNDDSLTGDIYSSALGVTTNTGISAGSPKRWVSEILEAYNLEPGDVIYVDTGVYQTSDPTVIGDLDAGDISQDPGRQMTVLGSTNVLAGGTSFILSSPNVSAFLLTNTYGVRFKHLDVLAASNGLHIQNSYFIAGDWLNIRNCEDGVLAHTSSNIVLSHSTLVGNRNAGIRFSAGERGVLNVGSSLMWSNRYGILLEQGFARASNSIFGMLSPESFGYYVLQSASETAAQGDYNCLYLQHSNSYGNLDSYAGALQTGFGSAARTDVFDSVTTWADRTGLDSHSLSGDPKLADPVGRDYHLKSAGGRYNIAVTGWVYDATSSALIDQGSPLSFDWTAEPDPNGRALNIGVYGGTAEASKTGTNGWIRVIKFKDGGSGSGLIELTWAVGGAATNYSVCLELSYDSGKTWPSNIVCGVLANDKRYLWDSEPFGRSARARWKIKCIENNGIEDESSDFGLRNGGTIAYYVNDGSTNGDVYCTATGNDAYEGLTPDRPVANLQTVLDRYELAPWDVVYVDSGSYAAGTPAIKIDQRDKGFVNSNGVPQYVTIQGSTNPLEETVFQGTFEDSEAVALEYAEYVRLKNLTIQGAKVGLRSTLTIGCELDNVRLIRNTEAGMQLERSENFRAVRSVFWLNKKIDNSEGIAVGLTQSPLTIENCVLWGSLTAINAGSASPVTASNCVMSALGANGRIYMLPVGSGASNIFRGDYNLYYRRDSALIAEQPKPTGGSDRYGNMPGWVTAVSQDKHSFSTLDQNDANTFFADENNGDFHPKSTQGRFFNGVWTNDTVHSPLIDAGSLASPAANEPAPNGGIINAGAYGNTSQASQSQTNPPYVRAMTYNCEGRYDGSALLSWIYGGMPSNTPVRLEYSTDYEITWHPIASGVEAGKREFLWDVGSTLPLSLAVYWRIVSMANTNVYDVSNCGLPYDPGTHDYYVNDNSTTGDIWCTGPGVPWDAYNPPGTNPAMPLQSLQDLLSYYPVEAGDRVFIDTGVYPFSSSSPIVFIDRNSGNELEPLKIYGSTNVLHGGAHFIGNITADGFTIQNASYIELYNIRISRALIGLSLANVDSVVLGGLELFSNTIHGVKTFASSTVRLQNSRIWKNGQYGVYAASSKGGQSLVNASVWGNAQGAVWNNSGQMNVSNSILVMTNSNPVYTEVSVGLIGGDYNMIVKGAAGTLAYNDELRVSYGDLRHWQGDGFRDVHSSVVDPLLVNPAAGDFHLQSRAGYWSNGSWLVSTNTSWAIDAGDPAFTTFTNETAPNGGRINLGAYGGTPEASRSDSSVAELLPTTLYDGGVASAGQPLYWWFRGINLTNTVRIEYFDGSAWHFVAGAVSIGSAPYDWFASVDPTPRALWRLILEANTNVVGVTSNYFTIGAGSMIYYVNDTNLVGDIYTSAIGSSTNLGYRSDSPVDSIQNVLTNFQLIGGDMIKVDTGVYVLTNSVFLSAEHVGNPTNNVRIIGSTNLLAGGSRLQPANNRFAAFELQDNHHVEVAHFQLTGFTNGVTTLRSTDCMLSDFDIRASVGAGVWLMLSPRIQLERVLIREGMTNGILADASVVNLESCVLWSNQQSAIRFSGSCTMNVTNSVLEASGAGNYCYQSATSVTIQANYNNLFLQNDAQVASIENIKYEKVPQWTLGTSQDRQSLSTNPRFHDPANGDFHLRSVAGRFELGVGWVQDTPDPLTDTNVPPILPLTNLPDFSPMIDMGAPHTAWSNEPAPHGSRRNIGLYGNTPQASKSNTNRWIQVVTAMSGGVMSGGINLIWGFGGGAMATNQPVQLEYSFDDRQTWIRIGNAVVGAGQLYWQSDQRQAGVELFPSSPDGLWRIYLLGDTNVTDMTDDYFGLRNSPFKYYLNDTSMVNDVYTTAPGFDAPRRGTHPGAPLLNLRYLLSQRQLGAGDYLYVDTGVYRISEPNAPWFNSTNTATRWENSDEGEGGLPVICRGSYHVDGSRFLTTNRFVGGACFFLEASHVDMQDLMWHGDNIEFSGDGLAVRNLSLTNGSFEQWGDYSVFEDLKVDRGSVVLYGSDNRVSRMVQLRGETLVVGTNVTMLNSVIYTTNTVRTGVVVNAASAVISNCTVVSTRGTALSKRGAGTVRVGHNILVAGGADSSSVIIWEEGTLISDWNNLLARDSAWVGSRNGKWEKLAYWQAASGQDANSVSFDPQFQNETAGDFHLNSIVGRWSPVFNAWDVDGSHSPVIDLGNPHINVSDEPMPNGNLRNLGAYGGTAQASKSLGTLWLTALTQNDGGVLKGPAVVLRWAAGNAGGKTVTLQYYDGTTWSNIATGVSAMAGSYVWNSTGFNDSFYGRWRVVAEDGSGVSDQTDNTFALRNQPHDFFVNDAALTGDIYCSAIGSDGNDGLTSATPKLTLQALLNTYDLEGGDVVYMDSGTYSSDADIRIIWSRSGSTNAAIVIQGSTNGTRTVLTRTGSTNFPAAGIDVKASQLQLKDLTVQGVDRGILLESNQNISISGLLITNASTAIAVRSAGNTMIRNSGFWRTGLGVDLLNTRTSVLENLTFAQSSVAGIQLNDTQADTMQNNIFVPLAGAYAYSIGATTSLLYSVLMDYNLYDFSQPDSDFYAGAPYGKDIRRWQVGKTPDYSGLLKDFRSVITNADLADIDAGDLHPRSEFGRWTSGGWLQDTTTSFAVDHGNPFMDFDQEPDPNGGRRNIGMYGNTPQASMGNTNIEFYCRTMNGPPGLKVPPDDIRWPFVWSAHLVDTNEQVLVQFSGDCGDTWITLTNTSAYTEYYDWSAKPEFQTARGRWRVIGVNDTNLWDWSDICFEVNFQEWALLRLYPQNGLTRIDWQGGLPGLSYRFEYSDNFGQTWNVWEPKYNGPAPINRSSFAIPTGQAELRYTFEDRTSYMKRTRWYRMVKVTPP